jgi:hypothetical protein
VPLCAVQTHRHGRLLGGSSRAHAPLRMGVCCTFCASRSVAG